ncbi:alpha/beta hydrolase [Nocardia huaxiensis]|uniref:Alpha/beta hydrolase n=1 Tax=Nocardia huaxiensis TaxID=2755382 RepID=A0A7D6V6M4_9NOCA|nr:alpha/beta hydrolase [Nocardia huaxiensis]QLY28801.1 alpha/beta hydrolase [Nocardia huaxiensis]UFS97723.1 alpha/beta hydrolase [Nocardia huaxiensis]
MNIRRPALIALAAALLAAATTATATATTQLPGTVDIRCAADTLHQEADWYLPSGTPLAAVWIQHGFARSNAQVAALARAFADAGYLVFAPSLPFMQLAGCTLQNLGDNSGFLYHVAELFGAADDPAGPLATSLAAAAHSAGLPDPGFPQQWIFIGHSAGAEAVTFVADRLRTTHAGAWDRLRGVILLDPVRSFVGDNIARALTGLDGTALPVLTISAPPLLCNSFGLGTAAVQTQLHRPFVGIRLRDGVHTDAEGDSSDLLGTLLCGAPATANATALRTLALGWAEDFRTGATDFSVDRARTAVASGLAADLLPGA